ncbi:glycosyltransferase family 4 protein [Bradyrhizobium iriomotense]|uniref:glycosyltransferase family 4 protein n=1 Tax=Bradyrhizobium iriomotense TaxID=441950 RepID=UPI001B8A23DA|nr:glycosyltransferase family 4 protein [Bradyrhizobium iriomotense]MBR1132234.1 glycosyltransferase family 4 protein [Bradyrhizobium iriomotense]
MMAGRQVLIIVENLPVPFDRRVWQEASTLRDAGALVSVICPEGKAHTKRYEYLDGIHIYRHSLPVEAEGALGFLLEYSAALIHEMRLALLIHFRHGFDVIHGCDPPDLIFLVALPFKLLGKKFIFDHHDIGPEMYESKFGKRGLFWRALKLVEWLTFKTANVVIATNDSYRKIAVTRGGKRPEDVFVVRSGPDPVRLKVRTPNPSWRCGRRFLAGYVGVMGAQEGIDLLLEAAAHMIHVLGRRDVQFCLVGGGPGLQGFKTLAEKMELGDYVTFTGRAPDDTLFEILSTADVCVDPDPVNAMTDKSTMNKVLEYMALGKPIVQFELTEGRFSAGDASVYAKPNDPIDFANKLLALLDDPPARARMGAIGRTRIEERFAWNYEAPKLLQAYSRALDGPGRAYSNVLAKRTVRW